MEDSDRPDYAEDQDLEETGDTYSEVDDTGDDDLMGAIGINLEENDGIIADETPDAPATFHDGEIDFEKIGINISRKVILNVGERINQILIHAIEEAVAEEIEKLKARLK